MVAGPIDEGFKETYGCAMLELFRAPVRVAVSRHHPLAAKDILQPQDLFGQKFLLLKRRGFKRIDKLRQTLERKYPQIHIMDFPFYDINVFNQCQSGDFLLMTIENWDNVHPLLKTPARSVGLYHSLRPDVRPHPLSAGTALPASHTRLKTGQIIFSAGPCHIGGV